jgi:hypothetical protein
MQTKQPKNMVSLWLEPMVVKYLKSNYGEVIEADASSFIGSWIVNAMVRKNFDVFHKANEADLPKISKLNTKIFVKVPIRYFDNAGSFIPMCRCEMFNTLVMKLFYVEFLTFAFVNFSNKLMTIQECCSYFRAKYDIDETELGDFLLTKKFYRFRNKNIGKVGDFEFLKMIA